MFNMAFTITDWNIENITGYKPITTFYSDFSIADHFGAEAILDTFNRSLKHWGKNYKYLTELVMALNWKIWEHYYADRHNTARLYDRLWRQASEYANEHLTGDELTYYYRTID